MSVTFSYIRAKYNPNGKGTPLTDTLLLLPLTHCNLVTDTPLGYVIHPFDYCYTSKSMTDLHHRYTKRESWRKPHNRLHVLYKGYLYRKMHATV